MKSTDPASLQNLNDIVMPATVGWWPLASGWYMVIGILFVVFVWLGHRSIKNWSANRYRRAALVELHSLVEGLQNPKDRDASLRKIPILLKRTALSAYPRTEVAMLSGDNWYRFLNARVRSPSFTQPTFSTLNEISYSGGDLDKIGSEAVAALMEACRDWLKRHLAVADTRQAGES